jgi:hypothetical protein
MADRRTKTDRFALRKYSMGPTGSLQAALCCLPFQMPQSLQVAHKQQQQQQQEH